MTALPHFYSSGMGGVAVINVFDKDAAQPIKTADSKHPHWAEIIALVEQGDESVFELFDVARGVMHKFHQVTDRVSWDGTNVLWDGDPVHSVLSDQLSRAIQDGDTRNYSALAKFWEKLESNPNAHSREQAYDFLAAHAFQITEDGDVVGFKGVTDNGDGTYSSWAASRVAGKPAAYVNGEALPPLVRVTQRVGDTVTMPRSEVVHDPNQACERGLHVATRDYAASYGVVMEVHLNPRDICSVPSDAGGDKVRACRYVVAGVAQDESVYASPVLRKDTVTAGWQGDVGYRV